MNSDLLGRLHRNFSETVRELKNFVMQLDRGRAKVTGGSRMCNKVWLSFTSPITGLSQRSSSSSALENQ